MKTNKMIRFAAMLGWFGVSVVRADLPVITAQPEDVTWALPGYTVEYSVSAEGEGDLAYQWRMNGTFIPGATDSTLVLTNVQVSSLARAYSCRVTGAGGSVFSEGALLVVHTPVQVVEHPLSATRSAGQSVTFTAKAMGGKPIYYTWLKDGEVIMEAHDSSYTISSVSEADAGNYSVRVMNPFSEVISEEASLTVNPDTTAPQVKMFGSLANRTLSNLPDRIYTLSGKATDDGSVTQVYYNFNDWGFQPISLDNIGASVNWSTPIPVQPGKNTLSVYAVDGSGNVSETTSVTFFYRTDSLLTVLINGEGSVNGVRTPYGESGNDATLQIGRIYTVKAFVGAGTNSIFTNWTDEAGNVLSTNAKYNFSMSENLVLRANFIPNPFVPAAGVYSGLFSEEGGVTRHSAGLVSLKVTPKQNYSAKILVDGNPISFSGRFALEGTISRTISRKQFGKADLLLNLALDFTTRQLVGTIQEDAGWTANLTADKNIWSAALNPAACYASSYTVVIPGFAEAASGPVGSGYGVASVDLSGNVKVAGFLADGSAFSQSVPVSCRGNWPFFAAVSPMEVGSQKGSEKELGINKFKVKEQQGIAMGWLEFATNLPYSENLAPQGTLVWIKTGGINHYSGGLTNAVMVESSRFVRPGSGELALAMSGVQVALTEGELVTPILVDFEFKSNNTFSPVSSNPNRVKVAINRASGAMTGTFIHPELNSPITIRGAFLQDQAVGRGFFLGSDQGGQIVIDPN